MFARNPVCSKSLSVAAIAGTMFLAGCNTDNIFSKEGLGLVSATVADSAAGNNFGNGSGNEATTAAGALAGGIIGSDLGAELDERDRREALNAEYEALEYSPAGLGTNWNNKASGHHGTVTPYSTYNVGTMNCRQYTHAINIDGRSKKARGTACKKQDGTWHPVT